MEINGHNKVKRYFIFAFVIILFIVVLVALNRLGTRSGVTDAQVREALPGDEIIPEPWISIDRAEVLPASAEVVWPWIVQLGKDRGGWYAPLWFENLIHEHSASSTLPQFQNLAVGDVVPDWGGGTLKVLEIVPNKYVLYASQPSTATSTTKYHFTWALVLEDNTATSTTFHLRLRIPRPSSGFSQYIPPSVLGLIDYATDRVLFRGLKENI
ncbi:hypothetical protein H0X32_03105 [Patescibacteria group bacterium]|nr:hypothetical protein [Patescibacteria group bacterium]